MQLKWYGQAAFRVVADDGTTIITDPYTPETSGYAPMRDPAHVVITSSDNDKFHCRADLIDGNPTVINALEVAQNGGERTEHGITFRAAEAMEALDHAYHDPDQNAIYRFEVDGIHIGHMGDIGNAFSPAQLDFFQGLDVMIAHAGGHPVIDLDDLMTVINTTKPKLVVPMHFRTLTYKPRNMFWIERLLSRFDQQDVDFAFGYETTITRDSLPSSTRILVLDYAR